MHFVNRELFSGTHGTPSIKAPKRIQYRKAAGSRFFIPCMVGVRPYRSCLCSSIAVLCSSPVIAAWKSAMVGSSLVPREYSCVVEIGLDRWKDSKAYGTGRQELESPILAYLKSFLVGSGLWHIESCFKDGFVSVNVVQAWLPGREPPIFLHNPLTELLPFPLPFSCHRSPLLIIHTTML